MSVHFGSTLTFQSLLQDFGNSRTAEQQFARKIKTK